MTRSSSEKKSIVNGVIYSLFSPLAVGLGFSVPLLFGVNVLNVLIAAGLVFIGIAWFGWACFARKEIFEEERN